MEDYRSCGTLRCEDSWHSVASSFPSYKHLLLGFLAIEAKFDKFHFDLMLYVHGKLGRSFT